MKQGDKLNIGCGKKPREGWVNLDMRDIPGVDVVRDVLQGLPFNDETFKFIYAAHIIEHIPQDKVIWFMNELWRVTQPGGVVHLLYPIAGSRSAYHNPTHISNWTPDTIEFFIKDNQYNNYYEGIKGWKLIRNGKTGRATDEYEYILEK